MKSKYWCATQIFTILVLSAVQGVSQAASMVGDIVEPSRADVTGTAKNMQGELLYREFHQVGSGRHRIDYQSPDGQWLAHKNIRYNGISGIISFDQYYPDTERTEVVKAVDGQVAIDIQSPKQEGVNLKLQYLPGDVIDVGFHPLVTKNWEELVKGEQVATRFLVFRRGIWIAMTIGLTENEECARLYSGDFAYCLTVRPESFFVRMVLPDMFLAYNQKKQPVLYVGPSNLKLERKDVSKLIITYQYPT